MKVTVKTLCCFVMTLLCGIGSLSAAQQWKDTIVVARDGTGDYRTLTEAMEGIRAFMDYKVTVLVKKGVYKEKVVLPSWLENVDFIGENVENTIITYDDHANINKTGTFRTGVNGILVSQKTAIDKDQTVAFRMKRNSLPQSCGVILYRQVPKSNGTSLHF